ncbi:MAG: hypothetical protein RJA49_1778 [Actinomycetota bacterium]|jgi:L-alanine-DL-glutamate epimerase-like enolase superfamily enzyme
MCALAAVAVTVPASCGKQAERSLCTVFAGFVESRVKVAAIDPAQTTAADAAKIAAEYEGAVAALQTVTDGRYGTAVNDLAAASADLRNTLESVAPDADFATWGPLATDELQAVRDASQNVESLIEPDCTSAS